MESKIRELIQSYHKDPTDHILCGIIADWLEEHGYNDKIFRLIYNKDVIIYDDRKRLKADFPQDNLVWDIFIIEEIANKSMKLGIYCIKVEKLLEGQRYTTDLGIKYTNFIKTIPDYYRTSVSSVTSIRRRLKEIYTLIP